LNDVHKSHKCIYIRQYHNARPYVVVSNIPKLDPTKLPYWDIYEEEGAASTIKIGGTMGGEFTAGLSGGQRKLLLFEIVAQRVRSHSDLLTCLDEPFAGVTDDFVPFIVDRLNEFRKTNQIVLVTNDHIETLKSMADNTITVSAVDRASVRINDQEIVDRARAIAALSVGKNYTYQASAEDMLFFFDAEIANNGSLMGTAGFATFAFLVFLATFWGSDSSSTALILIAGDIVSFYSVHPYMLSLVDWRNYMSEEAEALIHASKSTNKVLKTALALAIVFVVSVIQFAVTNAVIDGLESPRFWVAMLCDTGSIVLPFICLGLYSNLSLQAVENFANSFFLCMTFFSTTFSPGSGLPVIKGLRYLFPQFYYWCMVPNIQDKMEGCPKSNASKMTYMVLSAMNALSIFLAVKTISTLLKVIKRRKTAAMMNDLKDDKFAKLQSVLFGRQGQVKGSTDDNFHSGHEDV